MVDALLFCHCIFCLSLMFKSPLMFEGPPLTRSSVNSMEGRLKVLSWGITYFDCQTDLCIISALLQLSKSCL